jgi:hypothetical protein
VNAFTVLSGVESDAGTINYARAYLPRVRGKIAANCASEEEWIGDFNISVQQRIGGALLTRGPIYGVCGKPFSIAALSPGTYSLVATALTPWARAAGDEDSASHTKVGTTEIDVKEGADLDIEVKLLDSASFTGRVVCECETPLKAEESHLEVWIQPLEYEVFDDSGLARKSQLASASDVYNDGVRLIPPQPFDGTDAYGFILARRKILNREASVLVALGVLIVRIAVKQTERPSGYDNVIPEKETKTVRLAEKLP